MNLRWLDALQRFCCGEYVSRLASVSGDSEAIIVRLRAQVPFFSLSNV